MQTAALLSVPARAVAEIGYYWSNHGTLQIPRATGVRLPRTWYDVYQPIASFVRAHVPEDEPIYVGLIRHDAVVISNQAGGSLWDGMVYAPTTIQNTKQSAMPPQR